jgi:hypothetical protein
MSASSITSTAAAEVPPVRTGRGLGKNLERASGERIMSVLLGGDRRFAEPSPEELDALTLDGMRDAVMRQLHASNLEVWLCIQHTGHFG